MWWNGFVSRRGFDSGICVGERRGRGVRSDGSRRRSSTTICVIETCNSKLLHDFYKMRAWDIP
jgi:hypothetical protein